MYTKKKKIKMRSNKNEKKIIYKMNKTEIEVKSHSYMQTLSNKVLMCIRYVRIVKENERQKKTTHDSK